MTIVAQRTHSWRATCPETTLKQLLDGDDGRVIRDARDRDGQTALMLAAHAGQGNLRKRRS